MSILTSKDISTAIEYAGDKNGFRYNQLKAQKEFELYAKYDKLSNKYFNSYSTNTLPLKIIDAFKSSKGNSNCVVKINRKYFAGFHKLLGYYYAHPTYVCYNWLSYVQYQKLIPSHLRFSVRLPYNPNNLSELCIEFYYSGAPLQFFQLESSLTLVTSVH